MKTRLTKGGYPGGKVPAGKLGPPPKGPGAGVAAVKQQLWWHMYWGPVEALGGFACTVYGEATKGPDELTEADRTMHVERGQVYIGSFDHEPDDEEKNAAIIEHLHNANQFLLRDRERVIALASRAYFGSRPKSKERALAEAIVAELRVEDT